LLTSFAGPWTGLVLGGVCAVLVWVLPYGRAGAAIHAFGFVFLLVNILNFNPLMELDGYYLLVDLLDKPLLRARALEFVRRPMWVKLWHRQKFTREERLFAIFGLASAVFSFLMLLWSLRVWQEYFIPIIRRRWHTGGILGRSILTLIVALAAAGLVVGLWRIVSRASRTLSRNTHWLRRRLDVRRHHEAIDALRAVPAWREVPEPRLLEIARAMELRDVAAGAEVVRQGEAGHEFFVIVDGTFDVLVDDAVSATLHRGNYFGERALLGDGVRGASVIARSAGRLFVLQRADFETALAHDLSTRAKLDAAMNDRSDIASLPLFRDLTAVELDLLLSRFDRTTAAAGEEIITEGHLGDRFYVIRHGSVEVLRAGQHVARLGRGDSFGEIALLANVPRTATVRAVSITELLSLRADDFEDLLGRYCGRANTLAELGASRMRELSHSATTPTAAAGVTT
jgi:putative peptide zinc metalloprotease protein